MPVEGDPQEDRMPGTPIGSDPFQIFFDEFGTGFYQVFDSIAGQYGPIVNDPGMVVSGSLRYRLPEAVVAGDVAIRGPQSSEACTQMTVPSCSDGLRFVQDGSSFFIQFFSDRSSGDPADSLADTGLPSNFAPAAFVDETGMPEIFESFRYAAGPGPNAFTNFFNGVSDGRLGIPEPATMVLFGTALLSLGGALLWARA
jgi:hypothetical protein